MAASLKRFFLNSRILNGNLLVLSSLKLIKSDLNVGRHYSDKTDKPKLESFDVFLQSEEARMKQSRANEKKKRIEQANLTSFAKMFRNSKFVQLGDPKEKYIVGTIFDVHDDNIFIDFGGKFHCVCRVMKEDIQNYYPGKELVMYLKEFEMASSFLGSDKCLTLLEADATQCGLKTCINIKGTEAVIFNERG